jgi:predicted nucleotidyltransferase
MDIGIKNYELNNIIDVLKSFDEIESAIVFGSRAKGNYKKGSDIDLAIRGKKFNFSLLMTVIAKLDELYLPYKIDCIIYSQVQNTELLDHIDRVGITIYNK